jgi:hypothetical protein
MNGGIHILDAWHTLWNFPWAWHLIEQLACTTNYLRKEGATVARCWHAAHTGPVGSQWPCSSTTVAARRPLTVILHRRWPFWPRARRDCAPGRMRIASSLEEDPVRGLLDWAVGAGEQFPGDHGINADYDSGSQWRSHRVCRVCTGIPCDETGKRNTYT